MKSPRILKTMFLPSFARTPRVRRSMLFIACAFAAAPLHAQFTWNTTTGSWGLDANWMPIAVPPSDFTTQLIFPATTGYNTMNDIGAGTFQLNRITVNNTGTGTVTISAATTANTLTFGGTNPTLDITGTALFTGLLAGVPTVTKTGPGTVVHDSSNAGFTGTVVVDQGTFINRSTTNAVTNFNPVSIVVNNGGTYQFGAAGAGDPNLPNSTYITVNTGGNVSWQEGEVFGGFHLQGGTITLQASPTTSGTTAQNWTSGTLTGGNFMIQGNTAINKTTLGTVSITGNVAMNTGTGGLNILGGMVVFASAANLGTTSVSMGDGGTNLGTVRYDGATATKTGDFTISAGGGVINVESATTVLTLSGNFAGPGNVNKSGLGGLRLAGALNGTGLITASAGFLQVEPVATASGFDIGGITVLSVNTAAGTAGLATPSIRLANGTVLQFDLDTSALIATPLATITNPDGLVLLGTPILRLTNLQRFANGTYTLLDYAGAPISSGFNLALPGRTLGNLIYDTANTRINLAISGTDTLKWAGAVNTTWDLGTAAGVGGTNNWRLVSGGTATNFIDTDSITFDDTATRFDVALTTTVQPNATIVNAAGNYTFTGVGKLSGPTALTKSGAGTLSIATDNDYIGGTTVNAGTFQLGNGGATGSVVGTITMNGGALAFNRSDAYSFTNTVVVANSIGVVQNGAGAVTIANPFVTGTNTIDFGGPGNLTMAATVSGSGTLNKSGAGTLTLLANNNTFTGTLNVNAGTVLLEDLGTGGGDLGAASIVVNNGGTFILGPGGNTDFPNTTVATINAGGLFRIEQGENYGGFILNGGEFRFVSTTRTGVNSTAIAPVDGAVVYDLRSGTITTDITGGSGGGLNQGGDATTPVFGVLAKTTNGTVTVSGGVTFQAALAVQVKEGTLAVGPTNFPGATTAALTLGDTLTNGVLQLNGAGAASSGRPVTLLAGGGTLSVPDAAGSVTLFGVISGTGSLRKTGPGALILSGTNDYTGGTTVVSGALEANNISGSATGTGPVNVSGILSGDGAIVTGVASDITINGVFQPGFTGALQGTDFSLTTGAGGRTAFGSTSTARFDLWTSTGTNQSADLLAADRLLITGAVEISPGATLKLANPNALSFRAGDVFRLIDWTAAGIRTGSWSVDSSDLNLANLTVDTSNLYTAGTIAIVVPEPSAALLAMFAMTPCLLRRRRR